MGFYFNPLDVACKNVIGGVRKGQELRLNLFFTKDKPKYGLMEESQTPSLEECLPAESDAFLFFNKDGEPLREFPMRKTPFGWQITLKIKETGLYFYRFFVNDGFVSCGKWQTGEFGKEEGNAFLLTIYDVGYNTPEWFKGGVMYQIFPDRFCRKGTMSDVKGRALREDWGGLPSYRPNEQGKVLNNDFFGGNFEGVKSKLDYLKSLGVTVIYFNPVFEAASNHRYDTSDYMKIDPFLGTEESFKELVEAAKQKDIRVILDGVFNHTGDDSVYFNKYGRYPSVGAYQSTDSPYYSWYSFSSHPNFYQSWWGIDILPEVNETSEEYQEFIFGKEGVLWHWLDCGIGGYRLDVADELPDFFLKKLRDSVKSKDKDGIIIGEVWEDASDKIAYSKRREYLQGHELDSVMNYPLKNAIIGFMQSENGSYLAKTVRVLLDHYPKQTADCLMNILGTHDTPRILTVLGGKVCYNKDEMAQPSALLSADEKKKAIEKLKMAALLQFTLPGVPCVYYGDENGMEGHIDPFCRKCFDWEHLNEDLIGFYRKLGEIRTEYKRVFKDGEYKEIHLEDGFFVYKRTKGKAAVYVYANNCSKSYILKLPNKMKDCISSEIVENEVLIQPYSYGIFAKE